MIERVSTLETLAKSDDQLKEAQRQKALHSIAVTFAHFLNPYEIKASDAYLDEFESQLQFLDPKTDKNTKNKNADQIITDQIIALKNAGPKINDESYWANKLAKEVATTWKSADTIGHAQLDPIVDLLNNNPDTKEMAPNKVAWTYDDMLLRRAMTNKGYPKLNADYAARKAISLK